MDITGYSTDFVVDSTFPVGLKRFVLRQQERWPGLYLDGEPSSSIQLADWQPPVAVGEEYSEIITFSSGEAMESFWEENGYTLNAEGEVRSPSSTPTVRTRCWPGKYGRWSAPRRNPHNPWRVSGCCCPSTSPSAWSRRTIPRQMPSRGRSFGTSSYRSVLTVVSGRRQGASGPQFSPPGDTPPPKRFRESCNHGDLDQSFQLGSSSPDASSRSTTQPGPCPTRLGRAPRTWSGAAPCRTRFSPTFEARITEPRPGM